MDRAENLPLKKMAVAQDQLAATSTSPLLAAIRRSTTTFSETLSAILKGDRTEVLRVVEALNITESTLQRWQQNTSSPRTPHLKKLLEILPAQRQRLRYAIEQTFPDRLENPLDKEFREVPKVIYSRVMELVALTSNLETRRWEVLYTVFDYALLHLDQLQLGLALTYAELMPAREDGIHSLHEVAMRGTSPWPFKKEEHIYLGSTSLAGDAAIHQLLMTWSDLAGEERQQFVVDEFERSACAAPVLRCGQIAGVMIASSTHPRFFERAMVRQAIAEYAQLLALGLLSSDFYACEALHLRPMPDAAWQREYLRKTYMNRVLFYVRNNCFSRLEAEQQVRIELEAEFEWQAQQGR